MNGLRVVTAKNNIELNSKFGISPESLTPLTLLRTEGTERSLGQYKLVDGDRLIRRFNSFKEFKFYSNRVLRGTGKHINIQRGNNVPTPPDC